VTTAVARQLYPETAEVWVGKLSPQSVEAFIRRWQVRCILDASHPFAEEISRLAIAQRSVSRVSGQKAIAYLRYERTEVGASSSPTASEDTATEAQIAYVESLNQLLSGDSLLHQRVLFTVGYRQLLQFASLLGHLRGRSQLFVRILPSVDAISAVQAAGFSAHETMAIRPPVSMALEKALWQQWQISVVVAKASGAAGGETVKRAIAAELGTQLILIDRPRLGYPKQTNLISEAVEFCSETLRLY
jgi:precorrin-6A/cobalt-precorrin-6A reductase